LWCHIFLNKRHESFDLVPVLIGRRGENLRQIHQLTGAKIRVRGRGSGYMEVDGIREAPVPLMIAVTSDGTDAEKFELAVELTIHKLGEVNDITNIISSELKVNMTNINISVHNGIFEGTIDIYVHHTKDLNNLFGALDRAIPGLGKAIKQNANVGVAAGINALGKEAELEGKKARTFPLRFVDGTVFLGPLKVGQGPPLF